MAKKITTGRYWMHIFVQSIHQNMKKAFHQKLTK
jgi:hypothetical protein